MCVYIWCTGFIFFLEKIYCALTKSSEGLGAINLFSRTEERKSNIHIYIYIYIYTVCMFRRWIIYYVREAE